MGPDLLLHVVVAVLHVQPEGAPAPLIVQIGGQPLHKGLPGVEFLQIMVPDDGVQHHLALVSGQVRHMVEALVALRVGGSLRRRQQGDELVGQQDGIFHLVLGGAGMDVHALHRQGHGGGIEVLILDLPQLAAVHGVGRPGGELFRIKVIGALAHLLVRGEAHGDGPVRDLRMGQQVFAGGDDLRHAGLVVGSQQGGAVGDDQLLADVPLQEGEVLHLQAPGFFQGQVPALIGDDLRMDVRPADGGGGVHVGDEAQGRSLAPGGGGQQGIHIAVVVHVGPLQAQLRQLLGQIPAQNLLVVGGGDGVRRLAGGGVKGHIFQKTLGNFHDGFPP